MDDLDIELHSSSDTEEGVPQTIVVYEDYGMMLIGERENEVCSLSSLAPK